MDSIQLHQWWVGLNWKFLYTTRFELGWKTLHLHSCTLVIIGILTILIIPYSHHLWYRWGFGLYLWKPSNFIQQQLREETVWTQKCHGPIYYISNVYNSEQRCWANLQKNLKWWLNGDHSDFHIRFGQRKIVGLMGLTILFNFFFSWIKNGVLVCSYWPYTTW